MAGWSVRPDKLAPGGVGFDRPDRCRAASPGFPVGVSGRHVDRAGWDREDQAGAGGRATAMAGHQTLRATLDASYDLRPQTEPRLLWLLSVPRTGLTLEAATAVSSG